MKQHARILDLGEEEIVARRRAHAGVLFVHEKLSMAEDENRFFAAVVRFPIEVEKRSSEKAAFLALLAELINMIILGTNAGLVPSVKNQMSKTGQMMALTDEIVEVLRPKDCPKPAWYGCNLVLPLLQKPMAVFHILQQSRGFEVTPELRRDLEDFFDKEGALTLNYKPAETLLKKHGRIYTRSSVEAARGAYADILHGHQLEYMTRQQLRSLTLSTLAVAIIQEAEDREIVYLDGGCYHFEEAELDWVNVERRAKLIAPEHMKSMYSRAKCEEAFKHAHYRYFFSVMTIDVNWNRLRSKLSIL
jgi:hypothetical protein